MKKLSDHVEQAKHLLAKHGIEDAATRVHQMLDRSRFTKKHIPNLRDDILEELYHEEVLPGKFNRETTRHFPTPIRCKNEREEYILDLAKRFVRQDGKTQAAIERTEKDWAYQARRARIFLESREKYDTLKYKITFDEFFGMVRRLNAQKGAKTRIKDARTLDETPSNIDQPPLL